MRALFLAIGILLSSCAHAPERKVVIVRPTPPPIYYIGPHCTVGELVNRFYKEAAKRGIHLKEDVVIRFDEPVRMCGGDPNTIGCAMYDIHLVDLSPKFWLQAGCSFREGLVFHELAHTLLQLDHQKGTLMAPTIDEGMKCMANRKACLDQTFNRYKKSLTYRHDGQTQTLQAR